MINLAGKRLVSKDNVLMGEAEESLRVLLADDSAPLCASLASLLRKCTAIRVVGQVQDGLEAVELVRTLKPHVLVTDLRMGNVTGIEVLRRLREEHLHPIVIVFTSHREDEYAETCKALGARYFFTKPQYERVIETIKQLQRGGIPTL